MHMNYDTWHTIEGTRMHTFRFSRKSPLVYRKVGPDMRTRLHFIPEVALWIDHTFGLEHRVVTADNRVCLITRDTPNAMLFKLTWGGQQ